MVVHWYCCHTLFVCLQFTKDVVAQLDSIRINLRGIILLEAEGKQNLLDFSEAGLSEINYADYLEEVGHLTSHTRRNKQTHGDVSEWANQTVFRKRGQDMCT